MSELVRQFGEKSCKSSVPDLKVGMIVKVHQRIKEGSKERTQIFQGTVIKVGAGYGVDSMFTVRKISEKIGVEKSFPIHSPNVLKVEVLRAQKVRRAKLNFLRDRSGKALRLKEIPLKLKMKEFASSANDVSTEETEK